MGLDMYLKTMPKIEGYEFEDLIKLDSELIEDRDILPEDVRPYAHRMTTMTDWFSLSLEVGYWRKANQIHNWFVYKVQDGFDECEPHEVSADDLVYLVDTIDRALEESMRLGVESAAKILPIAEGFFFW